MVNCPGTLLTSILLYLTKITRHCPKEKLLHVLYLLSYEIIMQSNVLFLQCVHKTAWLHWHLIAKCKCRKEVQLTSSYYRKFFKFIATDKRLIYFLLTILSPHAQAMYPFYLVKKEGSINKNRTFMFQKSLSFKRLANHISRDLPSAFPSALV